jgi:hypothetical protein
MNIQFGSTPERSTARMALAAFAMLLFAGLPGLTSAQASNQQHDPITFAPLPTWRTIPVVGRRDTTGLLDPMRSLRPERSSPPAAALAKKTQEEVANWRRSIDYSGPRFGITYLPKAAIDSLKNHNINVGSTITQFGWQLEREIHVSPEGPRILNEWVFLAGGLESGVFLPSLTWLVGARDRAGNEIGVGPNASVAGVGLAAAAGVTVHDGGVNFPMNIAVAKSKTGMRVSFLTGFTIH